MANIALITNNILSDSGTALTSVLSGSGTTNYLSKFTGSTALGNSIIYDNGTAVGIGTTSPGYKLDVAGETRISTGTTGNIMLIEGSSGRYVQFGTDGSGQYIEQVGTSGATRVLRIQNSNGSGTYTQLFLDGANQKIYTSSNVNVIIGTSTDNGNKLQVNGSATIGSSGGADFITINGGPNGTASYYGSGVGNGSWDSRPNGNAPYINQWHTGLTFSANSYYGGIRFYNQAYPNVYSSTLVMSVTNDAVGIGTTAPTEKLSVNGNIALPKSGNTFIYNDQSGADSITIGGASYFSVKTYNGGYLEVFRATASTNLLIGTTTDNGAKLQVSGRTSVYTGATVTDSVALTVADGSNGLNYIPYVGTGSYNNLSYGGGSLLFNNISSRLTVGTHNGTAIQFGPTDTIISGTIIIPNIGGSGTRMVVADGSGTLSTQAIPTGTVTGSGTTNYLSKWSSSSSLTNSLFYDDGTNVGIGTTSPSQKLDVNGIIRAGSASSVSGSNILWGVYGNGALTTFGSMYSSGGPVLGYAVSPSTAGDPAFLSSTGVTIARGAYYISGGNHSWFAGASQTVAIGSSVSMSELMRIVSNGNVLIGTTTDSGHKLQVNGTAIFYGSPTISVSNLPQLTLNDTLQSHNWVIRSNGTSLFFIDNGNNRVWIGGTGSGNAGNVGIGTTSTSYKLDVNGTARIQNTLTVSNSSYTGVGTFYQAANSTTVIAGGPASENITFGPSNRIFLNASQVRIPIGSLQIASTLSVGTTNATSLNMIWANGSITAGSNIARGIFTDTTLVAAANNDVLVGLDVTPTFTNGAFTGVINYGIRTSGDIAFASAANRYLTMQSPSTSGSGGNMIIQSAGANTSGNGGNLYLYVGGGAGGPGPGKIYIGNNNGWDVAYVTGILTVSSTGPNTGDVLRVSGGGRNALTIAWDNLTPFMSYSLVSGRQSRFLNSSSYYFDNNFLIGTTTDGGYKLNVNGNGNFILGNSGYIRLQSGSGQRHGYIQSAFSNFLFSNNIYYDGSNWRYDQNGYGAQIQTETLSVGVIAFNTFASGTAGNVATIIESMRIVNNGNILMGTTTDSGYKLDVNGTSRFTNSISLTGSNRYIGTNASNLSIYITGGSSYLDGAYFNLTGNTYGASPGAGSAEFVIRTNSDSKFALFGYNGSSWSRYMTLYGPTGNLNIGSGTTDSGYKLRIEGNTYNDGEIISVGNITTNASAYVNANQSGYNLTVYPDITSGPNNLYSGGQVKANIYTSSNGNAVTVVPSTSQVVMAWYPSTTQGVFIDYTLWIYGGANAMRSGTFMVVNDSSGNVQYTDIATPDLNASTALATLAAANNGGVMEVTLTNGSGNVVFINTVTRYIPTMV